MEKTFSERLRALKVARAAAAASASSLAKKRRVPTAPPPLPYDRRAKRPNKVRVDFRTRKLNRERAIAAAAARGYAPRPRHHGGGSWRSIQHGGHAPSDDADDAPIAFPADQKVQVVTRTTRKRPMTADPRFDYSKKFSLSEKVAIRRRYWYAYDKQESVVKKVNKRLKKMNHDGSSERARRKLQAKETRLRQLIQHRKDDELRSDIVRKHTMAEAEKVRERGKSPWLLNKTAVNSLLRKRKRVDMRSVLKFADDYANDGTDLSQEGKRRQRFIQKKRRKLSQQTERQKALMPLASSSGNASSRFPSSFDRRQGRGGGGP